jgi:hypothetical protein
MTITNRNVLRPFQSKYLYFGHFLEELNASEWHFFHLIISFLLAIIVRNLNHAVELKILNCPSCFITLYISCEHSLKCLFKIKANVNYHLLTEGARVAQWVRSLDLTGHTSLSPIRRRFAPSFVNHKRVHSTRSPK